MIAQLNALTRSSATAPKALAGLVLLPLMRLRGLVVRRRLITDGRVIAVEAGGWTAAERSAAAARASQTS